MTKPATRWVRAAALASVAALGLSACGVSESSTSAGGGPCADVEADSVDSSALKGVTVKVGSKEFDEQLILGQLGVKMMCAAGADAKDETNSKGTTQTRDKMLRGGSDFYWSYTGTAWINFLGHDKPITDPEKQYEAVKKEDLKKNNVVWGPRAPFNNTYAFAVTDEFAKKNNLENDSDMAKYLNSHKGSKVCVESEYANRPDGYPGFKKTYGIKGGKQKQLGIGVIYTQTDKGGCDFGEVFTTDGRIKALGLTVLDDDKQYHPVYNAAPTMLKKTADAHPEINEVLAPLAKELTTDVMSSLNTKVSAEGQSPDKVATDFLKEKGFIK